MYEVDFYGQENPEEYYVIDQQDTYKVDTGYDAFLGVDVMLQGTGGNDLMVKVAKKLID